MFSSFASYKQIVIDLTSDLKKLKEFSEKLKLEGNVSSIDDVIHRLAEDNFQVAIIGEFKRGKSTTINALLGKDVLPMNVLPTTATLNKITYSITPFVKIQYKDGKIEEIGIDELNKYVTKLTKESKERAQNIKEATVYYPVNYCKNGVTIIDTPGLNDEECMTEVTMSVLPQIDAAIMVVMANSPFSESERDFLQSKVITSDLGRVLFVVTGIDLLDEDDVDTVLNHITNQIQEHVLEKAASTYGKESKEYDMYLRKLGNIRVYGVSSKKALKAKVKGDHSALEASGFPEFEKALERFLTEDRGAVMLNVPVSRIKTSSMGIVRAVELRQNALNLQKEEFDQKYEEAMKEIKSIREDRKTEFEKINESAQQTFDALTPLIKSYWTNLENVAMQAIDNAYLDAEDMKDSKIKDTQDRLGKLVQNAVMKESQSITERIQQAITTALATEAERISSFEKDFFQATTRIQNLFVNTKLKAGSGSEVISTITNTVIGFGIGGVIMGYRESGWKGALLGGATGFAGMAVGNIGLFGLLIPALAIPVTWPVAIIGGITVALLSTFSSKWALGKVFGKNKIVEFKNSYKEAVRSEIVKMKAEDNFSEKVRVQVESAFTALKDKIRKETDSILLDTQNQLTALQVELAEARMTGDKEKEELKQMLTVVDEICERADKIGRQLTQVLTR